VTGRLTLASAATLLAGAGCGQPAPDAAQHDRAAAAPATGAAPADSLVATAPGGAQIWLTLARTDSGAGGRCTARAVEIRRGDKRIPVPLLYTTTTPELIGDTAMRARLSEGCRPGDSYLVDLRTGRLVREHS
jgi:hypothetical protein